MNWDNSRRREIEQMIGLATGMIADGELSDMEIKYLSTWLSEHHEVTTDWPGSVVAHLVKEILAEGTISESGRTRLMKMLTDLSGSDFSETGSVTTSPIALPLDDKCTISLQDAHVCLTGEFLFGLRSVCEALAAEAGSIAHNIVTKKIDYLVIGHNVSPSWAHTSYGRKIEQAVALQAKRHPIKIISEQRWLETIAAQSKSLKTAPDLV